MFWNRKREKKTIPYNILDVERPDQSVVSSKREVILSEYLTGGDELG
ncbi:MAG: hypothetical protein HQ557_17895 [Bacteroidetes bacterium]|nr:hypothetical protein [Bacteroidota bacterium]